MSIRRTRASLQDQANVSSPDLPPHKQGQLESSRGANKVSAYALQGINAYLVHTPLR